jgi:rhomboid protease GluP
MPIFRFSRAPVTGALLVIIFAVFALEWTNGAIDNDDMLIRMGAIVPGMLSFGEYWRAIAAMFLHANVIHWAANSWALYQLGTLYEMMFGSVRFTVTYFVTGIIASIASSLWMHGPSVGASGAILGILGAFIFSIKRHPQWRNQPWTKSLLSQLVFWAGVNIVLGFSVKNIDNVAHIAGLISGLLIGMVPHRMPPQPPGEAVIDIAPRHYGSE